MRHCTKLVLVLACLFASSGLALSYTVEGNAPQSAENYKRWAGLIEVVNQPSRRLLFWCNGGETLYYQGDIKSLNQSLRQFAKVESPSHVVVLRPSPAQETIDCELHIAEGIARHMIEQHKLQQVRMLDPTVVIYVNPSLPLEMLEIPEGVQVQQISDLKSRYELACSSDDEFCRKEAKQFLASLKNDEAMKRQGVASYKLQLKRIASFVETLDL